MSFASFATVDVLQISSSSASQPVTQPTLLLYSHPPPSSQQHHRSQKNLCNYFPLSTSAEKTSSWEGRALLAVIESSCVVLWVAEAGSNSIVGGLAVYPTLAPICLNPCRISISNYLILTCEEDALHIEPWRSLGGCLKWRRNKGGGSAKVERCTVLPVSWRETKQTGRGCGWMTAVLALGVCP